jgi:methylenetetrahydrofolate--tRNA-(uracil-5-)-methyltransferase
MAAAERKGEAFPPLPPTTALGALINHITGGHIEIIDAGTPSFQPMNVNFGLFPPMAGQAQGEKTRGAEKGRARKAAISLRAARDLDGWMSQYHAAE